jgi:CubicO group peptidase (beta-lactamase class C family)
MNPYKTSILLFILCVAFNQIELIAQKETTLDTANLAALIEFSASTYTDEFIVIHKDQVVCHWKNPDCDSLYFNTASMVKSWTGLVIGILIDQKLIASENDLVCQYIPDWKDGCTHHITIKHLLSMSAGLKTKRGARGILAVDDMNEYALGAALDTLPDILFNYSNESVQLLGILIENLTGKTANEVFNEVLFEPLGMDSTRLGKDPIGHDVVYGGAITTLHDASKIGQLMLQAGRYNSTQIVSDNWIKKSTTPSAKAPYFGYLWWLDYNSDFTSFAAMGDGGQMTIVFPELEMVYLRRQSCNLETSGNMPWMGPRFLTLVASTVKVN